MAMD
jgi:phenylalanine-4-hydroxylase